MVSGHPAGDGAYVTLRARRARAVLPGCLAMLGGPLTAFGLWLVAMAVLIRPDAPTSRAQIVAGIGVAAAGLSILIARMRQTAGALAPAPEIALEGGHQLTPGAIVPLRLRLQATARLERLKVTLVCDRQYRSGSRRRARHRSPRLSAWRRSPLRTCSMTRTSR